MPTTNSIAYSNVKLEPAQNPESAKPMEAAKFPASKTIAKGTLLGELTASPGVYDAYDNAAGDGRQVCKGINCYDIVTDASGNITGMSGPFPITTWLTAPIYTRGVFRCEEMSSPTLLAAAIAAGYCHLIQGTASAGLFHMP